MQQPSTLAELIRLASTTLFGMSYQHDMAKALAVNRTTVRRWGLGQIEPREGVWRDLLSVIETKRVELDELTGIVETWVKRAECE